MPLCRHGAWETDDIAPGQDRIGQQARCREDRFPRAACAGLLCLCLLLPFGNGVRAAHDETAKAPYAVGSTTIFIHDPSRGYDEAAGVDAGTRTLITEIWYPVARKSIQGRAATYGDYVFGNRAVHRLMMTRTTFFHLTPETVTPGVSGAGIDAAIDELFSRERNSFIGAPVVRAGSSFPVIVMSHGDAGSRYNMQTACEYLAAHGYVVIAPEHTGNSPFSMSGEDPTLAEDGGDPAFRARMRKVVESFNEFGTYGPLDNHGQSYTPLASDRSSAQALVALDRALLQRIADLRATLVELERLNRQGTFAGTLNLERIGLMGRSFGASTVLAAMPLEPRFLAGAAVAPPSMPDPRPGLPPEALVPAGRESAILSTGAPYGLGEIHRPTLLLSGSEDRLIIRLAAARAEAMGDTIPTAENRFPVLRAAFETTDAPAVWAMLKDANHASFGVSGDYWWPELKPREFPRYFEPGTGFRLVDGQLAHRVQREKLLAFFDLWVADRPGARARLVAGEYADAGLLLEHRNF